MVSSYHKAHKHGFLVHLAMKVYSFSDKINSVGKYLFKRKLKRVLVSRFAPGVCSPRDSKDTLNSRYPYTEPSAVCDILMAPKFDMLLVLGFVQLAMLCLRIVCVLCEPRADVLS